MKLVFQIFSTNNSNPSNMEKQMTALMQSIQRKKEHLKEWELRRSIIDRDKVWAHECKIQVLRSEIIEDEKLLPVERQQIEDGFSIGQIKGYRTAKGEIKAINPADYYKNKYESK